LGPILVSEHAHARLDKIQSGATPLPPDTTAWDILEKDFLQSFVDYEERERACDELKRLSMAGDYECLRKDSLEDWLSDASTSKVPRARKCPHFEDRLDRDSHLVVHV